MTVDENQTHEKWMRLAIELAKKGEGYVEPNPMVGCVLVRDGKLIGQGWHQKFGGPHAEVNALRDCGDAAGATAYVTLEPCSHSGKTPPCADALIAAKVERVVVAVNDPNQAVNGNGVRRLRSAGVNVEADVCSSEALQVIAPFSKWISKGMPWVVAKWAMSADGKLAGPPGTDRWISNEQSRQIVHDLRRRMDAILVGVGTVIEDDPLLTARPAGHRKLCRVIMDSRARTPLDSKLVKTATSEDPVLICTSALADPAKIKQLETRGCQVFQAELSDRERWTREVLMHLGQNSVTNLFVEGGAKILAHFFQHQFVDEVHCFISPNILGAGVEAPFQSFAPDELSDELKLAPTKKEMVSGDKYLQGRVVRDVARSRDS